MIRIAAMAFLAVSCAVRASEMPEGFVAVPAAPDFAFAEKLEGEETPKCAVSNDFLMAVYPVTNVQYADYLRDNATARPPSYWKGGVYPAGKAMHPVVGVSRSDADGYCKWLSSRYPEWRFRLPTEAEWELAATGGRRLRYPWGNELRMKYGKRKGAILAPMTFNAQTALAVLDDSSVTNAKIIAVASQYYGQSFAVKEMLCIDKDCVVSGWDDSRLRKGFVYTDLYRNLLKRGGATAPVDAHPRNVSVRGCRGMAGNCWEWTGSMITARSGVRPGIKAFAVRGGAWDSTAAECSSIYRGEARQSRGGGFGNVGFRVAAERAKTEEKE